MRHTSRQLEFEVLWWPKIGRREYTCSNPGPVFHNLQRVRIPTNPRPVFICLWLARQSKMRRMTLEALKAMLTRNPVEPMRVKTNNGAMFEIRHPEMASFTKSALVIVHPGADGSPSDKVEYVSHLHVASVETLVGATA